MAYEVLQPVTDILVGPSGAAEGACVSVGGVVKFVIKPKAKTEDITSAAANMAVVGKYEYAHTAEFEVEGDSITLANLARAFAGTLSTTTTENDTMTAGTGGGSLKTPMQVYVKGLAADGTRKMMSIPAAIFETDGDISPTYKQQTWSCKGTALYDTGIDGTFQYLPDPVVATAPTLSSVLPTDGASNVAVGAAPALTFAVALLGDDVRTSNIFLIRDDTNAFIAGTVAQVGAVVTFTPSSNLTAGKKHRVVVVPGLRSIHGVVNPLGYEKSFTTAS